MTRSPPTRHGAEKTERGERAHALTDSGFRDPRDEACRFARGEASSRGSCTNSRFKDGRAAFPQEWHCRGRQGWSADRQRECTRLSVRRTGRPSGPAHTADVRTLEQSEFYVADAPAILAA